MQAVHRNVFTTNFRRSSVECLNSQLIACRQFEGTRSLRRLKQPQIRKLCGSVHFHYDNVELGPIQVRLDCSDSFEETFHCQSINAVEKIGRRVPFVFSVSVDSNGKTWSVKRSYADFVDFDKQLHRCVYDRRISKLSELCPLTDVVDCLEQLDNRGNRLLPAEETPINTPAVAAAYVVRNYLAQANNELTLNIGDIISVIDMPPASESFWWRGKLTIGRRDFRISINQEPSSPFFEVGFFPSDCVQLFGNRVQILPPVLRGAVYDKPVFQRRGKLVAFFRTFLSTRPSRRRLKESGILLERVFGCDLAEHLQNTGSDVPIILKLCCKVIESHGVVDGIYRLSGALSNIQKLRTAFDDSKEPDLLDEAILRDIHCVASLLKMYFRELPNPLFTYQLYTSFVEAANIQDHSIRILRLHDIVQQLPPPHFRTAEYLIRHLAKIGDCSNRTGMTFQNLAIVWAPNLLRCKELENAWESAGVLLRNINVQAVIVEYLIKYFDIIFSRKLPVFASCAQQPKESCSASSTSLRCNSRPQSLAITSPGGKLIDLEEAQRKLIAARFEKIPLEVGLPDLTNRKCIDVNGGPAALPAKYHTVIEIPARLQRKGNGWKNLFSSNNKSVVPSVKSVSNRHHRKFSNLPPTVNVILNEHRNSKFLRHVKSAESLTSSVSCSSDLPFRPKIKAPNRRSLREATPMRDDVSSSRRSATRMKSCLATDLDAAYSSNESHLFGALHPRYDERRRSSGVHHHHHGPYAISVHVNLEHISSPPMDQSVESNLSLSPRSESALVCYETSLLSATTTPVLENTDGSWFEPCVSERIFDEQDLFVLNPQKIAKVQPITTTTTAAASNNNSLNLIDVNNESRASVPIETEVDDESSKSCQSPIVNAMLPAPSSGVAMDFMQITKTSPSLSPTASTASSSVYALNMFDDNQVRRSIENLENTKQNGVIDKCEASIDRNEAFVAPLNLIPVSSLLDVDRESNFSNNGDCALDPEIRTLLSSVENLPDSIDTVSYSKKFTSFDEANALLQSFESLDRVGLTSPGGAASDYATIKEEDSSNDDDDDELLISLYENVDEESVADERKQEQKQSKKSFLKEIADATTKGKSFDNGANLTNFESSISFPLKNVRKFSDDFSLNAISSHHPTIFGRDKFTESDEEMQSRKVNAIACGHQPGNNDCGYSSADSNSTRSMSLKIADAIAMFEKSSSANACESNSGRNSVNTFVGDGKTVATVVTSTSTSSSSSSRRRPSDFVLVRTPSSYESADENELANSPLFRKQQSSLIDGQLPTPSYVVVDEMEVIQSHHRALASSSSSINSASAGSSVAKKFRNANAPMTNNGNNLQLYYV